jgi:hypothetical protein
MAEQQNVERNESAYFIKGTERSETSLRNSAVRYSLSNIYPPPEDSLFFRVPFPINLAAPAAERMLTPET